LAGQKERILFGLDIYKGTLYSEIYTIEKEVFMKQFYNEIFNT